MRTKLLHTIRWKLILLLLSSMGATAVSLLICYAVGTLLVNVRPINLPIRWIIHHIGSSPVMIIVGIVVFFVSFFMISKTFVRQLNEINTGMKAISNGRFDHHIHVTSSDEIGEVAESINQMTTQLSQYLEEITQGLHEIANGNFDTTIPVRPGSKLGEVADSINQMSRQLSHSIQEERNAEKTKNDLITGVSHDLRTPLTSILGFLEVIEEDRYQDEVELRYYVNIAYEKSLALKKLIDDLFEYTRINNGLPLEMRELDMVDFIGQLTEEFVPSFEKAGMECVMTATDSPLKVMADGDQLVRAYENLMTNALRYGRSGKVVDIVVRKDHDQVVVSFTNYGDPIPERDLPFIFDRFYRVESSRSKETGGTGLGLAITKSIIETQGGKISVRSNRQKTTFETRFNIYST